TSRHLVSLKIAVRVATGTHTYSPNRPSRRSDLPAEIRIPPATKALWHTRGSNCSPPIGHIPHPIIHPGSPESTQRLFQLGEDLVVLVRLIGLFTKKRGESRDTPVR